MHSNTNTTGHGVGAEATHKPTMGEKIGGAMDKLVGKATNNPEKVVEGEAKKTGQPLDVAANRVGVPNTGAGTTAASDLGHGHDTRSGAGLGAGTTGLGHNSAGHEHGASALGAGHATHSHDAPNMTTGYATGTGTKPTLGDKAKDAVSSGPYEGGYNAQGTGAHSTTGTHGTHTGTGLGHNDGRPGVGDKARDAVSSGPYEGGYNAQGTQGVHNGTHTGTGAGLGSHGTHTHTGTGAGLGAPVGTHGTHGTHAGQPGLGDKARDAVFSGPYEGGYNAPGQTGNTGLTGAHGTHGTHTGAGVHNNGKPGLMDKAKDAMSSGPYEGGYNASGNQTGTGALGGGHHNAAGLGNTGNTNTY